MSTVQNNVNINQNGEKITTLTQNVSMEGDLNENDKVLMKFSGHFPSDNDNSSLQEKTIFTLIKEDNAVKVKFDLPDIFKDKTGAVLSANPNIANDLDNLVLNVEKSEDNLERPITFTEKNGGLVVKIKSKDGDDYTITSSPTSISIKYGETSYVYSTENKSCIDVEMKNDVAKGIFSENSELSSYFKTPENLKAIPRQIFGLYAANLKGTQNIQLGDYNIFSFDNNSEHPDIFVSQPNGQISFFNKGSLFRCTEYFFQYDVETKEPSLIVKTTHNHYFNLNIKANTQDGQLILPKEYENIITYFNKNGVAYNAKNDNEIKDEDKMKIHCGENIIEFLPTDKRDFTDKKFKIKPDTIDLELPKEKLEIPPIFIQINNFYTNFMAFYNSHKEYQTILLDVHKSITTLHDTIQIYIDKIEQNSVDINELNDTILEFSEKLEMIYKNFEIFFKEHSNDPVVIELHNEITNIYNYYTENYIDNGKKGGDTIADPVGDEEKKKKEDEEKGKEKEKEKEKEKKKIDLKKPVETLGNMSMIFGIFLMIGAMIPGVGPILATIGAVMTGVGLAGVAFADKFVWSPYEKAKREFDETEYFSLEDEFFENEKELDLLHEQVADKFAEINQLVENDIEDGGNVFAKEFAYLYNKYGAAFPEKDENGHSRFEQLHSLEGFSIRRGIYNEAGNEIIQDGILDQLDSINKAKEGPEKYELISKFMSENFNAIPQDEQKRFFNMFDIKNQEDFNEFYQKECQMRTLQGKEGALLMNQKKFLHDNDKGIPTDRIFRLAKKANELNVEIEFFNRYGGEILKKLSSQKNMSYDQINKQLLSCVSEKNKMAVLEILDKKNTELLKSFDKIKEIAQENVTKVEKIKEQESYALAMNDLILNADKFNMMSEKEYGAAVLDYLQENTLSYYNNNPAVETLQQLRQGAKDNLVDENMQNINKALMAIADSYFEQPNSSPNAKYAKNFHDAVQNFNESCKQLGIGNEVGDLYKAGVGVSSIAPDPTKANNVITSNHTMQQVATRIANNIITDFEKDFTITGKTVKDKSGNRVNVSKEPLKTDFAKYNNAKNVVKYSKEMTTLQQIQEKGTAKKFVDIAKSVAAADSGLTDAMINDTKSPYNAQYKKLIEAIKKQATVKIDDKQIEAIAKTQIHINRIRDAGSSKYNDKKSPEFNPNIYSQYNSIINYAETYIKSYISGDLNRVVTANSYNYAIGKGDYVYSKDNLEKSRKIVLGELEKKNNTEKLIEKFPKEDQKIKMKNLVALNLKEGKDISEGIEEYLRNNIGNKSVEENAPSYEELRKMLSDKKEIDGKEIEVLREDEVKRFTERELHSADMKAQCKLSTLDETLRESNGNLGRPCIARTYKKEIEDLQKKNDPITQYKSPLDILEKRFGIDRDKLLKEIYIAQKQNKNINGTTFINNMLSKFGIDQNLYYQAVKEEKLTREQQTFDFNKSLDDSDKAQVEIYSKADQKEKAQAQVDKFKTLWTDVENGNNYDKFIKFVEAKENADFVEQLNLSYEMKDIETSSAAGKVVSKQKKYDIVSILQGEKNEEQAKNISNYGQAFNLANVGDNVTAKAEIELNKTISENSAKEAKDVTIAEQESNLANFNIDSDNFNRIWTNLKENPDDIYAQKAFETFCNNDEKRTLDFIKSLNINDRFVTDILLLSRDKSISTQEKSDMLSKYETDFDVAGATKRVQDAKQRDIDLLKAKDKKEKDLINAKYNLTLTKASANKFNSLWADVKNELDEESIDKFVDFINSNPEFTSKLNLPKSTSADFSYEIARLLTEIKTSEDSEELKLRRLENYEKQFKISTLANGQVKEEERQVKKLEMKAQTRTDEEFDLIDLESRLEEFDQIQKDLSANLSAIFNLDKDTYDEQDICTALNAYLTGDYTTLSKFNIDHQDVPFVDYQSLIAKLDELGNNANKNLIKASINKISNQLKKLTNVKSTTKAIDIIKNINKEMQNLRNNLYNAKESALKAFGKKVSTKTITTLSDEQLIDNLKYCQKSVNLAMENEKAKEKQRELEQENQQEVEIQQVGEKDIAEEKDEERE